MSAFVCIATQDQDQETRPPIDHYVFKSLTSTYQCKNITHRLLLPYFKSSFLFLYLTLLILHPLNLLYLR